MSAANPGPGAEGASEEASHPDPGPNVPAPCPPEPTSMFSFCFILNQIDELQGETFYWTVKQELPEQMDDFVVFFFKT